MRILDGNTDYRVDRIPVGVMGQSYVILSRSCDDFSDQYIIAGPAILEVIFRTLSEGLTHVLKLS